MANHSPEKDNYVAKKTFDTAVEGGKPDVQPKGTKEEVKAAAAEEEAVRKAVNEARGNGSAKKAK